VCIPKQRKIGKKEKKKKKKEKEGRKWGSEGEQKRSRNF